MKRAILLLLIGALVLVPSALAWHNLPVSKYGPYATEKQLEDFMEQDRDHVICLGVPRFGVGGTFPNRYFHVFDCTVNTIEDHHRFICEQRERVKVIPNTRYLVPEMVGHPDCLISSAR